MSRIGKKPISIPENTEVKIENNLISVKGPKGNISKKIDPQIKIEIKDGKILVYPDEKATRKNKKINALWGLTRAIIFNMIKGVTEGYQKKLIIEGVGYRGRVEGNELILNLGFSHPVKIEQTDDIKFSVDKNILIVEGVDKEKVGQIAAQIRKIRPPEPYKGKGIRYEGEIIRRKAGKKVGAAAS